MEADGIELFSIDSIKNYIDEAIEELVLNKMSMQYDRPVMSIASDMLLRGGKR